HGRVVNRQCTVGVIQSCWMAPGPVMLAISVGCAGGMSMQGRHCRPRPSSADGPPGSAIPPFPFSPVGFSAQIDLVFAEESRERFPKCIPSPLNELMIAYPFLGRVC